jgi:hypothetical protein
MQKGNTAKAMLTDEAFRAWCQRNQIVPETETYIQRIRSSQPVRKVQSHASNCTFYRPFHSQNSAYGIKRFTPEITAFFA